MALKNSDSTKYFLQKYLYACLAITTAIIIILVWFNWSSYENNNSKMKWIIIFLCISLITLFFAWLIALRMMDKHLKERKKSERIHEILYEISEAAYSAFDMYSLYKKIHNIISTLIPAKNFYIAIWDEKTNMITFPYSIDEYDPPRPPRLFGRSLTEYVLRNGKAVLLNSQQVLELRKRGEVIQSGATSLIWLGVPLKVGNKTIGIINVHDYEDQKACGETEMQLLTFVSEQIAQVIERKRNTDAINKYVEELKQLNLTKDKFFSIIAHDLKNPFITLLGFTDVLISDYSELSDKEKIYYITEMKKSAEVSHNLLQNLLQWSRSQTGRIEFNPQKINLHNIVHGNLDLLKAAAERKQIQFNHDIPDDLTPIADEDMLNTIIRNLLTNALKFTNKDGRVEIIAVKQNGFAEIIVSDTGIGMSEKVKVNLFRLDVSQTTLGTDNEAGTGLGLILCKEFVERNGGTIKVESQLNKGSKFIFTLPFTE